MPEPGFVTWRANSLLPVLEERGRRHDKDWTALRRVRLRHVDFQPGRKAMVWRVLPRPCSSAFRARESGFPRGDLPSKPST